MKVNGRMLAQKDQVQHAHGDEALGVCIICGEPAKHIVKAAADIPLCTAHFAFFFQVPPTRHAKQPKKKIGVVLPNERRFELRRHMKETLCFNGRKVRCDMLKLGREIWYFSLYENHDAQNSVLSVTRVFNDEEGSVVNVVRPNVRTKFVPTLQAMMHKHERIAPITSRIAVENAATRFLNEII